MRPKTRVLDLIGVPPSLSGGGGRGCVIYTVAEAGKCGPYTACSHKGQGVLSILAAGIFILCTQNTVITHVTLGKVV